MSQLTDLQKRFLDLYERSYRGNLYTFTPFLNEAEYADLLALKNEIPANAYTVSGGHPAATRVMVRFGNPDEFGYVEEFPITVIQIEPVSKKFAEELSHRDFLGALMNLGMQRTELGDILVGESCAHLICTEKMADYIMQNLTRIKHTVVKTSVAKDCLLDVEPKLERMELQVASERIDLFISKVCKLSRKECAEYFAQRKVFLNARLMENYSRTLVAGDVISVRGFGKFKYGGVIRTTQKGNLIVEYDRYVV